MRRLLTAAGLTLAVFLPAASVAQPVRDHRVPTRHGARCAWHHGHPVLFRVGGAVRLARAEWSGTRTPTRRDWRLLLFVARCQENPRATSFVHAVYRGFAKANAQRRYDAAHPTQSLVASWYDDGGGTASGFHSYYGFADCGPGAGPGCTGRLRVPFGVRVKFCYAGRCVIGVADDHGPYIGGRDVDLNQNIEAVLGFDGVATVSAQVL